MCNCDKCPCYICYQEYSGDFYEACGLYKSLYDSKDIICYAPKFIRKIKMNIEVSKENKYYEKLLKDEEEV